MAAQGAVAKNTPAHPESDANSRFTAILRYAPIAATLLVFVAATGDAAPGDPLLGRIVQHTPLGWMFADVAVFLAFPAVLFIVWCAGAAAAVYTKNWSLVAAALLVLIALGVNPVLKEAFGRPRPGAADLIVRRAASGYGFPSGHTSSATLMYGYAAVSLSRVTARSVTGMLVTASGTAIVMIAFERVYDGVHWPSDVLGGFVSGALLLTGCVAAGNLIAMRLPRRHPGSTSATQLLAVTAQYRPTHRRPAPHTRTFSATVDRRRR